MIDISIIIPTYNSEKYIIQAINSVLNQNLKNYEIIVIDDGSKDSTRNIIDSLIKNGTIQYFHQNNSGPGAARNRGLKEAKGEYICFLDADDELCEKSLAQRAKFLDDNPDAGLVFTDYYKLISLDEIHIHLKKNNFTKKFEKAILSKKNNNYIFGDKYFECALEHNPFILTSTVMMRKKILNEVGFFNTKLKIAEDVDFFLRISRIYKIGYIDLPLTKYNNFRSVLTKTTRYYEDSIIFYTGIYEEIKKSNDHNMLLKNKLSDFEFHYGYDLACNNRLHDARTHFLKSLMWKFNNKPAIKWFFLSMFPEKFINSVKNIKNTRFFSQRLG